MHLKKKMEDEDINDFKKKLKSLDKDTLKKMYSIKVDGNMQKITYTNFDQFKFRIFGIDKDFTHYLNKFSELFDNLKSESVKPFDNTLKGVEITEPDSDSYSDSGSDAYDSVLSEKRSLSSDSG